MNDRIKLAEAMGAVHRKSWDGQMMLTWPCGRAHADWHFNPFTDANDDYAVLEWMRDKFFEGGILRYGEWTKAINSVIPYSREYRVGDYARAALKVLG